MRWKETCLSIATSCFGWFDAQTKYDRYRDNTDHRLRVIAAGRGRNIEVGEQREKKTF